MPVSSSSWFPSIARLRGARCALLAVLVVGVLTAAPHAFASPSLVEDIFVGTGSSNSSQLTNAGGTLFFTATDGTTGIDRWRSDGTDAGTSLVADIETGPRTGSQLRLTAVGDAVFFESYDAATGYELWRSDGTEAGTALVKDIRPGAANSSLTGLTNVGGTLFFQADDGTHGAELWKSDGTEAGTTMVRDINPGPAGSAAIGFAGVGDTVFFSAMDTTEHGTELWKSDGTEAGTTLVKDIDRSILDFGSGSVAYGSSSPRTLTSVGDAVFFVATTQTGGTGGTGGTGPISDEDPWASRPVYSLWRSDGTEAGTTQVEAPAPGGQGCPANLTNANGTLFYGAGNDDSGCELWKTDGTAQGTVHLRTFPAWWEGGSPPMSLTNVGGTLFFSAYDSANGLELWKSDGTVAGTTIVKDIASGESGSSPQAFAVVGKTLYFQAVDQVNGHELWKSDGTAAGTTLVADIRAGWHPSLPSALTNVDGTLFFTANDGTHGAELWKYVPSLGAVPSSVGFESQDVSDGPAATRTALVRNDGEPTLTLSGVTLGGTDESLVERLGGAAGDCAVGTALSAGDTCSVRVRFDPASVGAKSATVAVSSDGGTLDIPLSGTGTDRNDEAPVIDSSAPATATEGVLYSYNATRTDADGPGQTWSKTAADTCGGSVGASTGEYGFTPAGPAPPPSCVVAVKVCDGGAPELCDTQETTVAITPVFNSLASTGQPQLSGSTRPGTTMSVTAGEWEHEPEQVAYQWVRCDSDRTNCIEVGDDSAAYELGNADVGKRLRARVTATDTDSDSRGTRRSVLSTVVGAPVNTAMPTISGRRKAGRTLTASNGGWDPAGDTYSFTWRRCDSTGRSCQDITGTGDANDGNPTYTLTRDDVGSRISVRVTATNPHGARTVSTRSVGPVTG